MKDYNTVMEELTDLVDEEEDLVVTTAIVQVEDEEDGEFFDISAARVEFDGEIRGVISYGGMDEALERAASQMVDYVEDNGETSVSTRHIEAFQAAIDELGFDQAIALFESMDN